MSYLSSLGVTLNAKYWYSLIVEFLENNDIIQTCLHISETGEAIKGGSTPTFSERACTYHHQKQQ